MISKQKDVNQRSKGKPAKEKNPSRNRKEGKKGKSEGWFGSRQG